MEPSYHEPDRSLREDGQENGTLGEFAVPEMINWLPNSFVKVLQLREEAALVNTIQNSGELALHTGRVRSVLAEHGRGPAYDAIRCKGEAIVFATSAPDGTIRKGNTAWPSRRYVFDVDQDVADKDALKREIDGWGYTRIVADSAGGADLWMVVLGPEALSTTQYRAFHNAILEAMPANVRRHCSGSQHDMERLRFVAADRDIRYHPERPAIDVHVDPPLTTEAAGALAHTATPPSRPGDGDRQFSTEADVDRDAIRFIPCPRKTGDSGGYAKWLAIIRHLYTLGFTMEEIAGWCEGGGAKSCGASAEIALHVDGWSGDSEVQSRNCLRGMAYKRGWRNPTSRRARTRARQERGGDQQAGAGIDEGAAIVGFGKNPDGLRNALRDCGLDYRHNSRSLQDEVRAVSDLGCEILAAWGPSLRLQPDGWAILEESHFDDLRLGIIPRHCRYEAENGQAYAVRYKVADFYHCLSALSARYAVDPFIVFLTEGEVPAWDGEDRWAQMFTEGYGVSAAIHSEEYLAHAGRLLFLPCVGRAFEPGVEASTVTVFVGKQGRGKSLGLRHMFPRQWRGIWFTDSVDLSSTTKEVIENSLGFVVVELSELAGAPRTDLQRIKAMVSRLVDVARLAYGWKRKLVPRRFQFAGTGNNSGTDILPEDEEQRRWWPVFIPDHSTPQRVMAWMDANALQLWAQGVHEYRAALAESGEEESGVAAWLNPHHLVEEQYEVADSVARRPAAAADLVEAITTRISRDRLQLGMTVAEMLTGIVAFGETGTGEDRRALALVEVSQRCAAGAGKALGDAVSTELHRRGWERIKRGKAGVRRWYPPDELKDSSPPI